jgi:hypothetical protein
MSRALQSGAECISFVGQAAHKLQQKFETYAPYGHADYSRDKHKHKEFGSDIEL